MLVRFIDVRPDSRIDSPVPIEKGRFMDSMYDSKSGRT